LHHAAAIVHFVSGCIGLLSHPPLLLLLRLIQLNLLFVLASFAAFASAASVLLLHPLLLPLLRLIWLRLLCCCIICCYCYGISFRCIFVVASFAAFTGCIGFCCCASSAAAAIAFD
jgi:hypothetical protein